MTEIETLREAAHCMRENATDAADHQVPEGRWEGDERHGRVSDRVGTVAEANGDPATRHIASWDPAVALSVADWLDGVASRWLPSLYEGMLPNQDAALNVARTYLREAS